VPNLGSLPVDDVVSDNTWFPLDDAGTASQLTIEGACGSQNRSSKTPSSPASAIAR
jgi:hypothetical protein